MPALITDKVDWTANKIIKDEGHYIMARNDFTKKT